METTSSTSTNVWISNEGNQKFGPPDSLDCVCPYRQIVSAGFTDGKTCYGQSQSLGVSSRKEDSDLL